MKNLKVWLLLHINSSFDEKGTKKRGHSPENVKIFIDKQVDILYNGIPYCDNMPQYVVLPSMDILPQLEAAVKSKV